MQEAPHSIRENYFLTKINISNYIEGKKLFQKVISHELIHAASSFKSYRKIITGFCQCYIKPFSLVLGRGINEGYTEVLSNRYVVNQNLNVKGKDAGYDYEISVAKIVELIIGKEEMIDMYFHGNLDGLIKELSKYEEEVKVKGFISDLDAIGKLARNKVVFERNIILNNLYNRINIFLYNAFSNKMNGNISTKEYLKNSRNFLELFSQIENNYPTEKKTKKRN